MARFLVRYLQYAEKNKNWDPTDMAGLQELVKAKKELEDLGRKRQQLHISFE